MRQPTFFDKSATEGSIELERLVLHALGDFQARGKVLAERDLPLDRLRGALRRASEAFGIDELSDEQSVAALSSLGAHVRRVPSFFAKHPYRVTVSSDLAERARKYLDEEHSREG